MNCSHSVARTSHFDNPNCGAVLYVDVQVCGIKILIHACTYAQSCNGSSHYLFTFQNNNACMVEWNRTFYFPSLGDLSLNSNHYQVGRKLSCLKAPISKRLDRDLELELKSYYVHTFFAKKNFLLVYA